MLISIEDLLLKLANKSITNMQAFDEITKLYKKDINFDQLGHELTLLKDIILPKIKLVTKIATICEVF